MGCVIEDDQNGQLVFNVAPRLLLIDAHGGIMLLLKSIYTLNKTSSPHPRKGKLADRKQTSSHCTVVSGSEAYMQEVVGLCL